MMMQQTQYATTAKVFHWAIVALILVQYLIGWFMPGIHRDMKPGDAMTLHISIGILILLLMTLRFAWRLTHPVAPESSLPPWQRVTSEGVHWLLYLLVFVKTLTGWFFASMRGWSISLFFALPLPMLTAEGSTFGRAIGRLHEISEWALLVFVGIHVAAALAHVFVYRDGVMRRMLPEA